MERRRGRRPHPNHHHRCNSFWMPFSTNAVFSFPTLKQQRVTREHTKSLKTLKIDVSASSQMKKKRNRFTKNGRPDWGGTEGESSQHIATKNANKKWEAAGGYRPK